MRLTTNRSAEAIQKGKREEEKKLLGLDVMIGWLFQSLKLVARPGRGRGGSFNFAC